MKLKRYIPNLNLLHSACETNYVRLLNLFPKIKQDNHRNFNVGYPDVFPASAVNIYILERCPYTTTLILTLCYEQAAAWLPKFCLKIRLYHDAKMAEVLPWASTQGLAGSYTYPNSYSYHPDEKEQLNFFLTEWLAHCYHHGYTTEAIGMAS